MASKEKYGTRVASRGCWDNLTLGQFSSTVIRKTFCTAKTLICAPSRYLNLDFEIWGGIDQGIFLDQHLQLLLPARDRVSARNVCNFCARGALLCFWPRPLFNGGTGTIRHGDPRGGFCLVYFTFCSPSPLLPLLSHPPQAFYLPPRPRPSTPPKIQKLNRNHHFVKTQLAD